MQKKSYPESYLIYLFKQVFADGRVMYGKWSPDVPRSCLIGGAFQEQNHSATQYLEEFGWPESPTVLPRPFMVVSKETPCN